MNYRNSRNNQFRTAISNDSYLNGYEETRKFVERESKQPPRGKGQYRGNPARKGYQENRLVSYRKTQSQITEADLAEELKRKLFPGVKSAQERLDTLNTLKAITLTITTRAIGFGVTHMFYSLYEFNNVPVRGSIYQFYRISLAIVETKVKVCQRSITAIQANEDDYAPLTMGEDMMSSIKSISAMPDQVSSVIKAVGKVKVGDKLFVPKLGKDNFTNRQNIFIPQAEQVRYSNLRRTVESLANAQCPAEYRRRFYRNNPIPGTIWIGDDNNPILANPDEIMPPGYDINNLNDDIQDLHAKLVYLNKKAPKYFTGAVNFEPDGTKAMLSCNSQSDLRVADRNRGENLNDYYVRLKLEGDVTEYFNLEHLNSEEQVAGTLALLGEHPATPALCYPVYVQRNERACLEYSGLKYRATVSMKYT